MKCNSRRGNSSTTANKFHSFVGYRSTLGAPLACGVRHPYLQSKPHLYLKVMLVEDAAFETGHWPVLISGGRHHGLQAAVPRASPGGPPGKIKSSGFERRMQTFDAHDLAPGHSYDAAAIQPTEDRHVPA